MMMMQMMYTI